jgi:hypothetical protein
MAAISKRKGIWVNLLTAVLGVLLTLPFGILHPVLPFAVLLIGYGILLFMQNRRWVPRYPVDYLIGCLTALILLLPAVSLLRFAEQGFNDGPFYGRAYDGVIMGEEASDRLDYQQGQLLIYNRAETSPPILAYQAEDNVIWAQEMDISQNSRYDDYQLSAMTEPSISSGLFRDRLNFTATWNFGTEQGQAYLWKWGKFHRFYLSWYGSRVSNRFGTNNSPKNE